MECELRYMGNNFVKVVRRAGIVKAFFAFLIAGSFGLIMAKINTTIFLIVVAGMYLYWYLEARRECQKLLVRSFLNSR